MICKDYEKQISGILDGEKLPRQILSHIDECKSCLNFYRDTIDLQRGFSEIEKLEPSLDFDAKILEKLKMRPSYYKILILISPFIIFISFLLTSLVVGRYSTQITVFCAKILKIWEVLSGLFSYKFYISGILLFLSAAFIVITFSVFDIVLLSKLIKNGGEL
ncbi:zf-HC2 domain-containing protein [bacterium]|nr:zf-HC2 domain-containing protein [bacterium]